MNHIATAQQMNFKTSDLIEKLKANRSKHISEHSQAINGYLAKIKDTLEYHTTRLANNQVKANEDFTISLRCPVSYEDEYSAVIEMLSMCTDETIMLDRAAFKNYVMDEWSWSGVFKSLTSVYNSSK